MCKRITSTIEGVIVYMKIIKDKDTCENLLNLYGRMEWVRKERNNERVCNV